RPSLWQQWLGWTAKAGSAPELVVQRTEVQRTGKTTGYNLAETHKAKTLKVANRKTGRDEMQQGPKEAGTVRGFAPVDPAQDLKRQLVIVTPSGETDFTPAPSLTGVAPTKATTGGGDHY